ncbi:MAG: hypothetical protein GY775_06490, partial [Candidatus Scalindua sp.]|nr:hypothetical protein [Candidatus Scalindua sp.]
MVELHAFSDASNSAYGTAVYFCCEGMSRLVMAKAKVAPIKPVTIPKLELTALLLAARLTTFITDAYQGILEIAKVHLWCDSQIALCWLCSRKVLPVYVNNRVDEIKSLLPNAVYRYVATKENPSDLITRGVTTKQLKTSVLWWEGPSWLTTKELWPEVMSFGEESHPITITAAQVTQQILDTEIKWNRFGSFDKLVRVIAWVIHYKQILLARVRGSDVNTTSNLAIGELRSAEENVVKLCQKEAYSKEYKALLNVNLKEPHSNITKQLGLYMEQGMIKCRGRIQFADISESAKYPILLPRDHHVTQLLIKKCHVINKHYGVNHVVAYMRQKWWIPKMRQTVKKVVNRCMTCKKLQAKPYPEINPPPLPEFRIQESEPFQFTGVDYTGAIPVKLIGSTTTK